MPEKLLLVDDEEGIRSVLGFSLRDAGYDLATASGVEEALRSFEERRPDIVLTDIKMPGGSGLDLLREIKARDPDVEVIMLTGHGDIDLAIQSLKLDATDFLTKPINDEVLEFALGRAGERIRMRRELREYADRMQALVREELRQTKERYQRLFEASPSYVAVIGRDMRLREANRRFREDFGEPEGRHCHALYAHRGEPCVDCPALRTFVDGRTHQRETVVAALDGRKVNVLAVTVPLREADGEIASVLEMSTDITELRALQDHLSQLGLLLGSTAHGIKGMLTAIDGSIYRMGSGLKRGDAARVEDGFRDMRLLMGRLRKMVLDILYYVKDRALAWESLSIAAFAGENADLVAGKAAELGVTLRRRFGPEGGEPEGLGLALGLFEADSGALSSALVNILENAIEAAAAEHPEGGGEVLFSVDADSDEVRFRVADNGPGMDRETRDKLFTLFFSSKGPAGTGIGLFVAGQMARQHGGRIDVASEPGRGAVFTLALPRRLPETARAAPVHG